MQEIDINDSYMCINVHLDEMLYVSINTNEWEGWTPILIDSYKSFTLLLFNFLQMHYTNKLSNKLLLLSIFSEYYTWDFRIVPCGFDIRPWEQFITSDSVHLS